MAAPKTVWLVRVGRGRRAGAGEAGAKVRSVRSLNCGALSC